MARDLAESPSVMMRVQPREFLPPASLASSSLAMPRSFECLEPLCLGVRTCPVEHPLDDTTASGLERERKREKESVCEREERKREEK